MMRTVINICALLVCFTGVTLGEKGKCVMYDCGLSMPCVYDGPTTEVKDSMVSLLQKNCPTLNIMSGSKVCCSERSAKQLDSQLTLLNSLFGSCPSCVYNIRNIFCQLACSPDQSDFLLVTKTTTPIGAFRAAYEKLPGLDDEKAVSALNYYISEQFVKSTYDSCKNVLVPFTSVKAVGMACGSYNADTCNGDRFFNYLGNNAFAPFPTFFTYSETPTVSDQGQTFTVMNDNTIPCSQPVSSSQPACSSKDCPIN